MSKRQFLVVLALATMVVGLTWNLSRAFPQPSAKIAIIHGASLISTDAESGDIATAVQRFHDTFCKWVVDKKGQKSDSSFGQSAMNWKSGAGVPPGGIVFRRGITVFNDRQGNKVYIEQTQEAGRSTFIRIEYQGEGGPMTVTNGLMAELQKMGVAVRRDEFDKVGFQVPKLDQAEREAIVAAADQAMTKHFKAEKKKSAQDEIDAAFWGDPISKLKPIRVRNECGHVAIVLSVKDGIEEGLFVFNPDSSHLAMVGGRKPLMTRLSTEKDRPLSSYGPLYLYKLQPTAK